MEQFDRFNKKIRNIAFVIVIVSIIIIIIWLFLFLFSMGDQIHFLLAIGIGLFLAGLLILTRIQYVIWINKKLIKLSPK